MQGSREEKAPANTGTPARPPLFSAVKLKDLFGQIAEALTGKPTPSLAARRKRREETKGAFVMAARRVAFNTRHLFRQFRKLAIRFTRPIVRCSIVDSLYAPRPYNPDPDRALKAERFLRRQLEHWRRGDRPMPPQHRSFGRAAAFDRHL